MQFCIYAIKKYEYPPVSQYYYYVLAYSLGPYHSHIAKEFCVVIGLKVRALVASFMVFE